MNPKLAEHIPVVNSVTDCHLLAKHFSDSAVIRLTLDGARRLKPKLPPNLSVWIDAEFDGLDYVARGNAPSKLAIAQFGSTPVLKAIATGVTSNKRSIEDFVRQALNAVRAEKPAWISVPQLPLVEDSSRNRINRLLAESTKQWAAEGGFRGKLILPIIVTHQRQINLKADRDPKVKEARACYERAGAQGFWLVESSLCDQDGAGTFDATRFPGLIKFHQEINLVMPREAISVGGPYWGLNLVLWARGIVKYPAIGLGNNFQYHISGGYVQAASARVALGPLKRLAVMNPDLKHWLAESLTVIPSNDPAHEEFQSIYRNFERIQAQEARSQVAKFYKEWVDRVAAIPHSGRALALYQEFSSAYVLGKGLRDLPIVEKTARRPERVAQQLMMTCL